jgi:hypothetical protein
MQRQLTAFVEQPSRKTFLAVRAAVLRECPQPIAAADLVAVRRLLEEGAACRALARIDDLPAAKVLSPRVHLLAAEAADLLGDAERGELERMLFVLVLQGLLDTGEGTAAAPYIVCQPSDEYDIAEALGVVPTRQGLMEREDKLCDVLRCTDGRELWFSLNAAPPRKLHRRSAKTCTRRARRRAASAVPSQHST